MADGTIAGSSAAYPATVRYAEDGEDVSETDSTAPTAEDLANRTAYLKLRADRFDAAFGSASVTRIVKATPYYVAGDYSHTLNGFRWGNLVVGTRIEYLLDVPSGATITGLSVAIDPAGGHGALPATMPSIQLTKQEHTTGTRTDVGTAGTDTSANVGAYEPYHLVSKAGLTEVVNNATHLYYVTFDAEAGANSIVGTVVQTAAVTYTPS